MCDQFRVRQMKLDQPTGPHHAYNKQLVTHRGGLSLFDIRLEYADALSSDWWGEQNAAQ